MARLLIPYAPTRKGRAASARDRRNRAQEVAGPYRSQSSNPKIRSQATRHEHRKVTPPPVSEDRAARHPHVVFRAPTTTTGITPSSVLDTIIALGSTPKSLQPQDSPLQFAAKDSIKSDAEALKESLDQALSGRGQQLDKLPSAKRLGLAADILTTVPLGGGIKGVEALSKASSAIKASEKLAAEAGAASKAANALRGGVVRRGAAKAAQKLEPATLRAKRLKALSKLAKTAEKVPRPVRVGAKVGGRVAAAPVKHPFTAPLAVQVPAAVAAKDPHKLVDALEGKGAFAAISAGVAGGLGKALPGEAGKLAEEAVDLPSVILPSAYLTGKAGVNVAQGNPADLKKLLDQWRAVGLLPALAEGDGTKALKALSEHPLFSGLEASGALNAAGRGAGALARATTKDRVGGLARPDLPVRGTGVSVKRRYSRDLLRQGLQRAYDRTPSGQRVKPDTLRGRHLLKEAANRFEAGQEAIRKDHAHTDVHTLKKILNGGELPKRRFRLDRKAADVVNLAVERIVRHPETFHEDLQHYKTMIEAASKELRPDGKPRLDKAQRAANKALLSQIDSALKLDHPGRVEGTVKAANAFIELQQPILEEMVDLGLLDPQQAATAAATSFARVHLGADFKDGVGLVDHQGNKLTLDQITAEMEKHGVEPPGFLSHRTPSAGDFYQPSFGGANLPKGERSGAAVVSGSQLGGIESLVRQIRRSRGLVDRAKSWNSAVTRFGVKVPGVETWADAQGVLKDPARYGLDPAIQPMAVPRYPFMSKKGEIVGVLEHQSPAIAGEAASGILSDALSAAQKGDLAPDTRIAFMPGKVVEQLRAGAEPAGGGLRGAQAATSAFTRTVLPFSPGWYIGNGLDNAIRTALAGINPAHFLIGSKVRKTLTPEQRAELLAGAHYSSVGALNPHRNVEALVRGYDPLSKGIRSAAEWGGRHGWKQAVVKFAPALLSKSSDFFIDVNRFLTEDLPQRGALGRLALREFRDTQHSWMKALADQKGLAEDFAKKARNPDRMIRFQKDLEEVYGNYTRMSPTARKLLRNISPFWTWFRAAYKFAFVTMPAHRSISTAFLTAAAQATKPERESYGLDKMGEKPLPDYMQGAIPLPGGGIFPAANYSSFGYAGSPANAVGGLVLPQYRSAVEALAGRDWKGDELPGGEGDRWLGALWTLATSFVPGAPVLADESEGRKSLRPHLNLPHPYPKDYVEYKRTPTKKISVPDTSSSSGSGVDYGSVFSGGGSGSEVDYGAVFGGGE